MTELEFEKFVETLDDDTDIKYAREAWQSMTKEEQAKCTEESMEEYIEDTYLAVEEAKYRDVVVDKDKLEDLVGYVYGLLEFIDVDDLSRKNRKYVVEGFDEYVKPMMREDFPSPFAFVRNDSIQVFKEQLEDEWDIDTSKLSLNEIKEVFDKVEQEKVSYTELDMGDIIFNAIKNTLSKNGLCNFNIDDIIADAKERTSVAENSDVDKDLDL